MRMPLLSSRASISANDAESSLGQEGAAARQPRRGVTAMEYLVMLSFLLLAIILAVQHIGSVTKGLFQNSAEATSNTNGPSSP